MLLLADSGAPDFNDFFVRLFIDLVAFASLAWLLYYRRHGRRDLVFAFGAFNLGVFVVLAAISAQHVGAAVGFGLFALLSIIRLRSEPFDNLEIGYFFASLVLAVATGLDLGDAIFSVVLVSIVLLGVFFLDHDAFRVRVRRRRVVLDRIHTDIEALSRELSRDLNLEIVDLTITEIDYVRESTDVTLRFVENPN
jgi:hypothetical protein